MNEMPTNQKEASQTLRSALENGFVVREPVGKQPGYWAGAPGAFFAGPNDGWYLTYRIRRPRGVEPDRGGESRIAHSKDLKNWKDVWSVTKDRLNSASIERCALRRGPDGLWHHFISYVDPADGRWCLSVMKARDVASLSLATLQPVFKAKALGLEGVKDPWLFEENGTFHMLLSVALPTAATNERSHDTLDIYNTGECVSATALASSRDLSQWDWKGVIFAPEKPGWEQYCRRINSIIPHDGKYFGFYDGSASSAENYEEKTGLAVSTDLKRWQSLTTSGPLVTSPHGSGSLRYVDAQVVQDKAHLFYEFARPDGAHDLRLVTLPLESLPL